MAAFTGRVETVIQSIRIVLDKERGGELQMNTQERECPQNNTGERCIGKHSVW